MKVLEERCDKPDNIVLDAVQLSILPHVKARRRNEDFVVSLTVRMESPCEINPLYRSPDLQPKDSRCNKMVDYY